jgi:hypothetical protein
MIQMAEYNKSVSFNFLNCLDIRRSEPATAILLVYRGAGISFSGLNFRYTGPQSDRGRIRATQVWGMPK